MGRKWMTTVSVIGIVVSVGAIVLCAPLWGGLTEASGRKIAGAVYPWLKNKPYESLESRVEPPAGFRRVRLPKGSFGEWLRKLPMRPGRGTVRLHDGQRKSDQTVHHAVFEIDVGRANLQQCADAIIRLRAEFLRSRGCRDGIAFHFTSGDLCSWSRWRAGYRPKVRGNRVTWAITAGSDASYANFRKYLNAVFTYAGTLSLAKELKPVKNRTAVMPGDVFIHGGSPGHAVLVVDVAAKPTGERVFLLAQSYMPAQDVHLLKNPGSRIGPWYPAEQSGSLDTPEWSFRYEDLKRFPPVRCRRAEASSTGRKP